jgi:hypothetical protein
MQGLHSIGLGVISVINTNVDTPRSVVFATRTVNDTTYISMTFINCSLVRGVHLHSRRSPRPRSELHCASLDDICRQADPFTAADHSAEA